MKPAPKTSQPSAPGYTLNSQTSTGRLFVRRAEKPLPQLPTYTLTTTSQQHIEPEPLNVSFSNEYSIGISEIKIMVAIIKTTAPEHRHVQ
jgi:hypothetical protein